MSTIPVYNSLKLATYFLTKVYTKAGKIISRKDMAMLGLYVITLLLHEKRISLCAI